MKKISFTIAIICSLFSAKGADLIVAEGGQGGAYATINEAITAAVSGDRILIYPKQNGAQYSENITLTNKSLQLLSATEGTYWKLFGNITITPSSAGMNFVIQLANITNGDIVYGASSPVGTRTKVSILGCKLDAGNIDFNANYFDMNISNNILSNGYVYLRFGRVIGNSITTTACVHNIYFNNDLVATNDINYAVGNYLNLPNTSCGTTIAGVYINNSNQYYYIANNFIDDDAAWQNPIYVNTSKSGASKNYIINNSLLHNGSNNTWGLFMGSAASPTEVFNNSIYTGALSTYGFYGVNSVNSIFGYNYTNLNNGNQFSTFINDGTNGVDLTMVMSTTTGEVTTGISIDGGSPDNGYLDLDLSRNDADCFGGSYSMSNFTQTPTGAITTFVIAPRRVLSGQTININADGYDR
jgi:hypothetical protein